MIIYEQGDVVLVRFVFSNESGTFWGFDARHEREVLSVM